MGKILERELNGLKEKLLMLGALVESQVEKWFEDARVKDRLGKQGVVKQPHVDLELCIGCGICETECPLVGQPAIYVISVGESRSKENQILL